MDPNMINDMMKNPELMSQMDELMKDPNMMNNLMSMMGGMGGLFNSPNPPNNTPEETNKSSFEHELEHENKLKDIDLDGLDDLEKVDVGLSLSENKYAQNERVVIKNLNNKLYNSRLANIVNYDKISNRYIIFVDDMNKNISIKEENIEKIELAEELEEPKPEIESEQTQVTPPTTEAPQNDQENQQSTEPPKETPTPISE